MALMFILWLLVVSSLFHPNARWLFVFILLRNAYLDFLPIFKSGICFLMIELFDFCIDFVGEPRSGIRPAATPTPPRSTGMACLCHLLGCAGAFIDCTILLAWFCFC